MRIAVTRIHTLNHDNTRIHMLNHDNINKYKYVIGLGF